MKNIEKKHLKLLKEKYFYYKDIRTQNSFNTYYDCMELYCELYGYDMDKKSKNLESKWDNIWKKENN